MLEDLDDVIERCAVAAADRVPIDQAYPEVYNDINWLDEKARAYPVGKATPGNNGSSRSPSKARSSSWDPSTKANISNVSLLPNSLYIILFDLDDSKDHANDKNHIYVCSPYHKVRLLF